MFLYQIKRSGMSLKEGYIGITNNTSRRFSQHLRDTKNKNRHNRNYHLYNAMRKYDDIEFIILKECDSEYAMKLEKRLRPLPNIGWNQAVGGCNCLRKKRGKESSPHPVMAEGIVFDNKRIASEHLGINPKTIYNRCKRGIEGYKFLRDTSNEGI